MNKTKVLSIVLVIFLIVNLILFGTKRITPYVFWIIIGVIAFVAYFLLPYFKKKHLIS